MAFNTKTVILIIVSIIIIFSILGVMVMFFTNKQKTTLDYCYDSSQSKCIPLAGCTSGFKSAQACETSDTSSGDKNYYCYNKMKNTCFTNASCTESVGKPSEKECLKQQKFFCYDSNINNCYTEGCLGSDTTTEEDCLKQQKYCLNNMTNVCYTENCTDSEMSKEQCNDKLASYCLNTDTNSCEVTTSGSCGNGYRIFAKTPKSDCRKNLKYFCYDEKKNACENTEGCTSEYTNKDDCEAVEKKCYNFNEDLNECKTGECSDKENFPLTDNCISLLKKYCIEDAKCNDKCTSDKASDSKFACINEELGIEVTGDFKLVTTTTSTSSVITIDKLTIGVTDTTNTDVSLSGTINVTGTDNVKVNMTDGTNSAAKTLVSGTTYNLTYSKNEEEGESKFYCSIDGGTRPIGLSTDGIVTIEFSKVVAT